MPKKDTTPKKDVSKEEILSTEEEERVLDVKMELPGALDPDDRENALEMLAQKAIQPEIEYDEDHGSGKLGENVRGQEGGEGEEESEKESEEESEKESEKESEEEEKPPEEEQPPEEMIDIKVYGEVKQYPKSQVDEHGGVVPFQKELAADRKQEEANRRIKDVEARERALQEQQIQPPPYQPPPQRDAEQINVTALEKDADDLWLKYHEENSYGDETKARELLVQARDADRKVQVAYAEGRTQATPESVSMTVKRELANEKVVSIREQFQLPPEKGGFGDLCEDPVKYAAVTAEVYQSMSQGANGFNWDIYEAAGKKIRETFTTKPEPTPEEPPEKGEDEITKRKTRKKKIDTVRTASVRQQSPEDTPTQSEQTARTDAVGAMIKQRGG